MASPQYLSVANNRLINALRYGKGVSTISDDLLIIGQGDTDEKADLHHHQNLRNLLDRCRARNIKLNKKNFQFKCSEVSFIGNVMG